MKNKLLALLLLLYPITSFSNEDTSGTGTVAETMSVGSYVYVLLEENQKWIASSPVPVKVGDQVEYTGGALMNNFYSPKLDRTFDDILFVMNLNIVGDEDEKGQMADPHAGMAKNELETMLKTIKVSSPEPGEIERLAGGKTIAEVWVESEGLVGTEVSLRARVMKVSLNIMNKNWITLQDGTGSEPDDKLIATSSEVVEIGELVTVKGVVRNDVALGSGYNYKVLLEEATFSR